MPVVAGSAAAGFVWGWLASARLSPPGAASRLLTIPAGMFLFVLEASVFGGPEAASAVVAVAAAAILIHRRWISWLRTGAASRGFPGDRVRALAPS